MKQPEDNATVDAFALRPENFDSRGDYWKAMYKEAVEELEQHKVTVKTMMDLVRDICDKDKGVPGAAKFIADWSAQKIVTTLCAWSGAPRPPA